VKRVPCVGIGAMISLLDTLISLKYVMACFGGCNMVGFKVVVIWLDSPLPIYSNSLEEDNK
jgi:hypothetical protein